MNTSPSAGTMDWPIVDLLTLFNNLLPGFVAAWVFYGLTAHPKTHQFERVVQALIFAVPVQLLNVAVREMAFALGGWHSFGEWSSNVSLFWSYSLALFFGFLVATAANNDFPH